jgi:tetratricopeptide (TPR) repeat protein
MTYRTPLTFTLGILLSAHPATAQHEGHELGEADFRISCSPQAQEEFHVGLAQLHHMMYGQAREHFEAAAEADAQCAMAHWGIAMTSFQPLWHPTSEEDLERGRAAVEAARELGAPTERERAHIAAAGAFFTDPVPPAPSRPADHEARVLAWKEAQRELHEAHREDVDAAAFFHSARGLGAARSGALEQAAAERDRIQAAVRALRDEGDDYWAHTSEALGKAVDAWILYERGETERALALMSEAADLEDSMEKHPITPGEILPVRELYADMLLLEGRTDEAIAAYEASLERTPNRRYAEPGLERARANR